jgi:hypothetical protein
MRKLKQKNNYKKIFVMVLGLSALGLTSNVYAVEFGAGTATSATAAPTEGKPREIMLGGNFMYSSSEKSQGDQKLPGGSNTSANFSLQYALRQYYTAFGLTYQMDKVGQNQTNTAPGVKAELNAWGCFVEFGFGMASQSFSNRAISTRAGTQTSIGAGVRSDSFVSFVYYEMGVRQRTTVFKEQDGEPLANPVTEKIILPFLGIGIKI